jgi:endonuclease YncB( thermonuclease family)
MPKRISILCQLLIAFILMMSTISPAFANDFSGHKNETAIKYLMTNKIVSGYTDGTFKPNNLINRAELLKLLVLGKNAEFVQTDYKNCFSDVREEWFAPFVCYAKEQGWVDGYSDGTFKPAKIVNKAEAIKMLINSQEVELTESNLGFSDVQEAWYTPYLKTANALGILERSSGLFGVGSDMTRGEIAENLYRAVIVDKEAINNFSEYKQTSVATNVAGEKALVTRVIDGDTIEVKINENVEKIRLIGIDTPETVSPNVGVECFGHEASNKAKADLVNKSVILVSDDSQGDKDKYGRLLRYIYLEGQAVSYNEQLILGGFAEEYTYDEEYELYDRFADAELEAILEGKGMWSDDACSDDDSNTKETGSNNGDYVFYVSSQARTKYYCETDSAWENLSKANLLRYESEDELRNDFPSLTLNRPC